MCGAALIAPLAMALVSTATNLVSGKSQGTQTYTPDEVELNPNPQPDALEPTLGVDNADNASTKAKGKSSLVIPIARNPSVGVTGAGSGTGVSIPQG